MTPPNETVGARGAAWQNYLRAHRDRFLAEAQEFLRIPSVSTLPDHQVDVERAARWVAKRVKDAGVTEVDVFGTEGHPVVLARWWGAPGKPTALVYGHFDTQPADPLDRWVTPPFEPCVRDDRIYARGASDDKGNMLAPILALEALLQSSGELPLNVTFLFEGEEEIGSPNLATFVAEHRDALACDLVLSADGNQLAEDQPHLIMSCRGLCSLEVAVVGVGSDLHSGLYGGAVPNPLTALVRVLASMHSADGTVSVSGFYDDVRMPSDDERQALVNSPFEQRLVELGFASTAGEPGYTASERVGLRPTIELNGITGGFQGEGIKTVIPGGARAKLSCRLVPDQTPAAVFELLRSHVERHRPQGVDVDVLPLGGVAQPYRIPLDARGLVAAGAVLTELYGREPVRTHAGASLPVCETFLDELDAHTIFFGFALDDENIHGPNEFLRVASFERAQAAYCALFERLGVDA